MLVPAQGRAKTGMEGDKTMSLRSRAREKQLWICGPLLSLASPCLMKRYCYCVLVFAFNFLPQADYRSEGIVIGIVPVGQVISA